jgi:hypothetical protein
MICVTSEHYAVLVNGIPSGRIFPTRGIQQGNPISPYLFLICAEALSLLLLKVNSEGEIKGSPPLGGVLILITYFLLTIVCFFA